MADDLPAGAVQDPGATVSLQKSDLPAGAVPDQGATVNLKQRPLMVGLIKAAGQLPGQAMSAIGQIGSDLAHPIQNKLGPKLGEAVTGAVYGLDKGVLGLEELLPEPFHGAAARGIQQINKETPAPLATDVASMAPVLAGGEGLGVYKAGEALIPAAREGASLLPRAVSWTAKIALPGVEAGAELGLAKPTGEEDYSKSLGQKTQSAVENADIFGGLGIAGGALGAGARGVGKVVDIAKGKPTAAAIERLSGKATEGATTAIEEKGAEGAAAEQKAGVLRPSIHQETERLDSLKGVEGDANAAADRVLKSLAAEPGMSAEKFGERVRAESEAVAKKYRTIREEKAGFKDVFKSASKEPDIGTSNIIRSIGEKEWNTTTGLERIKNELMTGDNKQAAITLEKAHSLKMELDDMWKTAKQRHVQFSEGKAAEEAKIYDTLRNQLRETAAAKYPKYGEALKIFQSRSRPLDFLERKSALAPLLRRDPYSKEYLKEPGNVVSTLLNRVKAGNTTFARLIKENPALKDEARQFFLNDLHSNGEVTPAKLETWFRNRKNALEQTGLLDEFTAIRNKMASTVESVKRLSAEIAVKRGDVDAIQKTLEETEAAGKVSAKTAKKYETLMTELNVAAKPDKSIAKTLIGVDKSATRVAGKTRQIYEELNADGYLTQKEYESALQQIQSLEAEKINSDLLVSRLKQGALAGILLIGTPLGLGWTFYHVGRVFTGK
jgi:hypothetical protein